MAKSTKKVDEKGNVTLGEIALIATLVGIIIFFSYHAIVSSNYTNVGGELIPNTPVPTPTSVFQPMEFEVLDVQIDDGTVLALKLIPEGTFWVSIMGRGYYAEALNLVGQTIQVNCWRDAFFEPYTACDWFEFFEARK